MTKNGEKNYLTKNSNFSDKNITWYTVGRYFILNLYKELPKLQEKPTGNKINNQAQKTLNLLIFVTFGCHLEATEFRTSTVYASKLKLRTVR
jgi:hypothetical protein